MAQGDESPEATAHALVQRIFTLLHESGVPAQIAAWSGAWSGPISGQGFFRAHSGYRGRHTLVVKEVRYSAYEGRYVAWLLLSFN
jgi:hypothetical protein